MMTTTNDTPRVWVGCLACYNAGNLRGEWVDAIDAADLTPEQLHKRPTSHEELWCFDVENMPEGHRGEMSPVEATRIAETIDAIENDGHDVRAVFAWADYVGGNPLADGWDAAVETEFTDAFYGEWDSFKAYAEDLAEQCGTFSDVPEDLQRYIDFDAYADEMEESEYHTIATPTYTAWVFRA